MNNTVKRKARVFIRKYSLLNISYDKLIKVAEKLGYVVIEFNNCCNDKDVETVIKNLKLEDIVLRTRGFTYADLNYRLIFINEDLNNDEKELVLLHEIGHIVCGHFSSHNIIGNDVMEEYEANEFVHYILNQSKLHRLVFYIAKHKKVLILTGLSMLVIGMVIYTVKREKTYYGDYYITSTGNKYHEEECIFVKDKTTVRRLSKEQFETGKYEACDMCLPE